MASRMFSCGKTRHSGEIAGAFPKTIRQRKDKINDTNNEGAVLTIIVTEKKVLVVPVLDVGCGFRVGFRHNSGGDYKHNG